MMMAVKILMNDVHCNTGSRGMLSLRDNASCVDIFFLFFSQKRFCVKSEENQCDTEESHD